MLLLLINEKKGTAIVQEDDNAEQITKLAYERMCAIPDQLRDKVNDVILGFGLKLNRQLVYMKLSSLLPFYKFTNGVPHLHHRTWEPEQLFFFPTKAARELLAFL